MSMLFEPAQVFGVTNNTWRLVLPMAVTGAYLFMAFGFLSRRCERQADVFGSRSVSCAVHQCGGHSASTNYPPRGKGLCVAGIDTFANALQKVLDINGLHSGTPREPSKHWLGRINRIADAIATALSIWLHSTVANRIDFLRSIANEPQIEAQFQKRLWVLRSGIVVALAATIVIIGMTKGWGTLLHTL